MKSKLSDKEVKAQLQELPNGTLHTGKLHREYKFDSFAEAFGFMSTCALVAQKQDHHPEWSNIFDRVVVDGGRLRPWYSPMSRE